MASYWSPACSRAAVDFRMVGWIRIGGHFLCLLDLLLICLLFCLTFLLARDWENTQVSELQDLLKKLEAERGELTHQLHEVC